MASFAEEVGVARVGELDGHLRAVVVGLHHEVEVVGLRGKCRELGVDVELSLPLATANTLGKRNLVGVAALSSLGVGNRAPAVVGKPVTEGIEQRTVVNTLPQVGAALIVPVHYRSIGIVGRVGVVAVGRHGAVVVVMVLQHDVGDVDVGLARSMAEVEDELHGIKILAGHIACPVDVVFASLQIHLVFIDDGFVIGLVGQLDDDTFDVTVRVEDTGEVVALECRGDEVGVEVYLSLPLGKALQGNRDVIVVVATLEQCSEGIGLLLAPSWIRIVVERHRRRDALPHVEVAVGVESVPFLLGLLRGEDEAPGNGAVGSVVDEHQLLGRERLDAELRLFVLAVGADIGE